MSSRVMNSNYFNYIWKMGSVFCWGCLPSVVPPESVQGPLLLLTYINDLMNTNIHGSVTFFADNNKPSRP